MNPAELDAVLGVLTVRAGALRSAGVLELTVGDVRVALAPPDAPAEEQDEKAEPVYDDPLDDPMTFGRRSGVPGFPRDEEQQQ